MESFLAGLALVTVGLVAAFFGYRFFRILLPVYGAVAGFVLVWGWWGESHVLLALAVGAVFALVLAILAYGIWSLLMGAAGAVFGLAFAGVIVTSLHMGTVLAAILAIVCAVAYAVLFVVIRNEMVIIATGLTGAATAARGVAEWFGLEGGIWAADAATPAWLTLLMAVLFAVLALLGIWFQWRRYRRLDLYGPKPSAEPVRAAAAAERPSSIPVLPSAASTAQPGAAAAAAAGVAVAGAVAVSETEPAQAKAVEAPAAEVVVAAETPQTEPVVAEVPEAAAATAEPAAGEVTAMEEQTSEPAEAVVSTAVVAAVGGNKVEDTGALEDAGQSAVDTGESTSPNVVDEVVNEIERTYSFDDIAKFKEKLEYVEGIGPAYANKLRAAGVNTVLDLLHRGATRKGRADLVEATGITGKLILRWVNHADLYRIKGVRSEYADLLEAAGVDTVVELAYRNPANLLNAVLETNKVKKLVRQEPVEAQIEDWVSQARKLPRVIQY